MKIEKLFLAINISIFFVVNPYNGYSQDHVVVNQRDSIVLTSKQKMDDVRYLYSLIRKTDPFTDYVVSDKGLESIYKHEIDYIDKAGISTNQEFNQLITEILVRLSQGAVHTSFMPFKAFDSTACSHYDISKSSIELNKYWWDILEYGKRFTYTDINIKYKDGDYIVLEDFEDENISVSKGAKVLEIDGIQTLDYVKSLQNDVYLRFDTKLKIPYSSLYYANPFVTIGNISKKNWDVVFQNLDGYTYSCEVPKRKGFRQGRNYPNSDSNVLIKELTNDIAYLRVFNFPQYRTVWHDIKELEKYFAQANGKYKKLIIDLRGNSGGIPTYGEELLIKPFIKQTYQYVQFAAVKKDLYPLLSKKMALIDSMVKPSNKDLEFGEIERIQYNELPDSIKYLNDYDNSLYYFKTKKNYQPSSTINFNGKIFLLIDNQCFSATEDIIRVFKKLDIATIVGTNSGGGAAVIMIPLVFELPNSHILFAHEVELAFNTDGTINEIYGTKPDIEIEPSTYPTSFPVDYSIEGLLKDKWITWILNKN